MSPEIGEDGPEVEAEESVRAVSFVMELLYLEAEGGLFKEPLVLPVQE